MRAARESLIIKKIIEHPGDLIMLTPIRRESKVPDISRKNAFWVTHLENSYSSCTGLAPMSPKETLSGDGEFK